MGIEELLMSMRDRVGDDDLPRARILPEAMIMSLREAAVRYELQLRAPRFQIGDLIAPMQGMNIEDIGQPHLVVDTRVADPDFGSGQVGACQHGMRLDTRVLMVTNRGSVVAFWVESYAFERWVETSSAET